MVDIPATQAAVTDTYAYDAFGNTIARTGTTVNPYQYRGEQYDASLQMYYLRARYYRPQVGRFLTQDSYEGEDEEPLSLHKYLYANADPVDGIDPSGYANLFSRAFQSLPVIIQRGLWYGWNLGTRTLGIVRNGGKIAYETVCCLDKTWSVLDLALQVISGIEEEQQGQDYLNSPAHLALMTIDIVCRLGCGDPTPLLLLAMSGRGGGGKNTGFEGLSDEEIRRRSRDKSLPGKERKYIQGRKNTVEIETNRNAERSARSPSSKQVVQKALSVAPRTRRLRILKGIARGRNTSVLDVLRQVMYDRRVPVRLAVADTLGLVDDLEAPNVLADYLHDRNEEVRVAAVETLVLIRSPQSLRALLAALENDKSILVRIAVIETLQCLRNPAAVKPLRAQLLNRSALLRGYAA